MKDKKKEYRSVRKTKRKLREGLIDLMNEKPVSEIKVKELCEKVDINRGTFYYHYTDIFDMINSIEDEFFKKFNEIIKNMNVTKKGQEEAFNILEMVFEFFDKNAELSATLIGPNGNMSFLQQLKDLVDDKCSDVWNEAGSHMEESEYELFNSFIINGYIGLLERWLQTGRKQSPEYMANFVAKLIIPAAVHTLALNEDTFK